MIASPILRYARLTCVVIGCSPLILRAQDTPAPLFRPFSVRSGSPVGERAYVLFSDTKYYKTDADSAVIRDTTRMTTPELAGTYDRSLDSTKFLTREGLTFLDYRYLGGILETLPGVFIRDQQSEGQYSQLTVRAADWRSIAVTMNGRLLNDPASGIYNLYHFSPEFADRIELISGPRAFLYGLNSTGGAVNLVTRNYNSNRPLSKIIYYETAYNAQLTDGTFSQNISRRINVTFGFQHQSTDGRLLASVHDGWNMRVKLRYNLSRHFDIILSEYLTHTQTDLNGGVDPVQTGVYAFGFDRIRAVLRNYDAFEKLNRHDLDLSLVGTILGDTTNVTMLSFYYSNLFREYRDGSQRANFPTNGVIISSDHRTSWMGVLFTQDYHTELQRFNLGANIELRQIEGSPNLGRRRNVIGGVWAKEEVLLGNAVVLAGFARYDRYLGRSALSVGADATLHLGTAVSVSGGLSTSKRFPTYQELYWTDSTVVRTGTLLSETHRTLELGLGVRFDERFNVHLAFFHRTVLDPILIRPFGTRVIFPKLEFVNGEKLVTNGVEVKLRARFWVLALEGSGMFLLQQDEAGRRLDWHPRLVANGGVYYWQRLLNDRLELKVGVRGRYTSGSRGEEFNPEVLAYVENTGSRLGYGSSVDGFLIAAIGDAHVHFMWENLTNARYYITPYYPVMDRAIRFGIHWQFLD